MEMKNPEPNKVTPGSPEHLTQGIDALRSGQRARAQSLFARAVRQHPGDPMAWLWLSRSVDDKEQKRECLARARRLMQSPEPEGGQKSDAGQEKAPTGQEHSVGLPGVSATSAAPRLPGRRSRWKQVIIGIAAAVVLSCLAGALWRGSRAQAQNGARNASNGVVVEASGVIQGEEVSVSSEYGGPISALLVEEGQEVVTGQTIAQLDTALLDAQIEAAQAAIALAEADLARARAGARQGQIAAAEARLAQAEAARIAATQAVSDTTALVENPQEIRMQIAVLQAQIEAEKHRLAESLALKDAAEIGKDQFGEAQERIMDAGGPGSRHKVPIPGSPGSYAEYTVPSLPMEAHLAPNAWWQSWVGVNATAARVEGLEASLSQLYAQRQHPQELETQVDAALSALAQAEAQAAIAQAQVDALRTGASAEQIAALEARIDQARAALITLWSQRDKMKVRSPLDGTVTDLPVHRGEVAAPGATLATIANLRRVTLTVYVPETQVGHIHLEQSVEVAVDSAPGRAFHGTVLHIADTAEFTPRNVSTQEERVHLVFAVEIGLGNEDGALKPGMPADAVFRG
ncbi:MAG: efflux RND transporter periplasmic adaptor subunit [Anaerolineae bacterium]|nr:efflux RND transporter periplasmic adaptor subunit [Anaerolineae bacterium]